MILGLDIGGTSLKLGAWRLAPSGLERTAWRDGLPLPDSADGELVAEALAGMLCGFTQELDEPPAALGIGSCGLISGGIIHQSPNTPWDRLELVPLLSSRLPCPVRLLNDADAFLLHALAGLPERPACALGITLGTGVGTAVWLHGQLLAGGTGISPEGGHITIDYDGPEANTGIRGSLESLCCAAALLEYFQEAGGDPGLNPRQIMQAAQSCDGAARVAWERYGASLGAGLGSFVNLFAPQCVLLGGGLAGAHEQFEPALLAALERSKLHAFPMPELHWLDDDADAVARGAALFALEQM